MGCWNKSCILSNLHITSGTDVYVFVMEKNKEINSLCYSTAFYSPLLLPFESKYNDYGGGEESSGPAFNHIMKAIKDQLVEMEVGENQYHDIAVTKEGFGETMFFDAVHECRLKVKSWNNVKDVTFGMMRKDVVDYILTNWVQEIYIGEGKGTTGWGNSYSSLVFADILVDVPDYINQLALKLDNNPDDLLRSLGFEYMCSLACANKVAQYIRTDSYRYSHIIRVQELIIELVKSGNITEATSILTEYLRGVYIDTYMDSVRKSWIPGAHEGSQSQEHGGYRVLIDAMTAVLDLEKAEWDEDDEDE